MRLTFEFGEQLVEWELHKVRLNFLLRYVRRTDLPRATKPRLV